MGVGEDRIHPHVLHYVLHANMLADGNNSYDSPSSKAARGA